MSDTADYEGNINVDAKISGTESIKNAASLLDDLQKSAQKVGDSFSNIEDKVSKLTVTMMKTGEQFSLILENAQKLGAVNFVNSPKNPTASITTKVGSASVSSRASPEAQADYDKAVEAITYSIIKDARTKAKNASAKDKYAAGFEKNAERKLEEMPEEKEYLKQRSEYYKARASQINSGENNSYENNLQGGIAAALFNQGERFSYHGGLTGMFSRAGMKWGDDQNSLLGRLFGKGTDVDGKISFPKGNINTWFGGALAKGTVNGLGINAGALAIGGAAVAATVLAENMKKLADECLNAYGSMQKLEVGLEVVYGSKTESNQAFQGIQNYAVKSPYGVTQTTEMAVLLKQSGVYSSNLLQTLEMIGDVSSGNEEKMKRIANNYAQVQAIGHASMLDMRQFAYAGIPIYKEVADYMKVSQTELRSMISDGKVTSDVIENVFKKMTSAGGTFYGAVEKGAKTYSARKQNYEDVKNIAKANVGEYLYNYGSSSDKGDGIGSSIMGVKESFQKGISDFFSGINIESNYNTALKSESVNDSLEKILSNTTSIDGKITSETPANNVSVRSLLSRTDDDTIRAAKLAKFDKDTGFGKKTLISSSDARDMLNMMRDMTGMKDSGYGEIKDAVGKSALYGGIDAYSSALMSLFATYSNPYSYGVAKLTNSTPDSILKSYNGRDKSLENLNKALETTYTNTERYNTILEYLYSVDKKRAALGEAAMISDIASKQKSYFETMQSYSSSPNSITSLTDKYNQLYAQTKQGKAEQAKKDAEDLGKYKSDYDKYSKMVDSDGTFNYKDFTKDQLVDAIKSGIIAAKDYVSLKPEDLIVNPYDDMATRMSKAEGVNSVKGNVDELLTGLKTGVFDGDLGKKFADIGGVKAMSQLFSGEFQKLLQVFSSSLAIGNSSDLTKKRVEDIIKSSFNLMNYSEEHGLGAVVSSLYVKGEKSDKSKYNGDDSSGGAGGIIPALWKRILGGATGIDASHMVGATPEGVLDSYQRMQSRSIVGGGISGMVASGMTAQEIANSIINNGELSSTIDEKIKQNTKTGKPYSDKNQKTLQGSSWSVKQIDWSATESEMIKSALSVKDGLKKSASTLSGLSSSMKSQLGVYDKIKQTMYTQGEEFANITTTGIESVDKAMENAFGSNGNGAATASWVSKGGKNISAKTHYEKGTGWVVDEGVYSQGEYAGKSIEEINRTDKDRADKPITVNVSEGIMKDINPVIDSLQMSLALLSTNIDTANTLQQKALSLRDDTKNSVIENYLNNKELFSAMMNMNPSSPGATNPNGGDMDTSAMFALFVKTMTPILSTLSNTDFNKVSFSDIKDQLDKNGLGGITEGDLDKLKSISTMPIGSKEFTDALKSLFDSESGRQFIGALKDNASALKSIDEEGLVRTLRGINPSSFSEIHNGNSYLQQKTMDEMSSVTGISTKGMSFNDVVKTMTDTLSKGINFAGISPEEFKNGYYSELLGESYEGMASKFAKERDNLGIDGKRTYRDGNTETTTGNISNSFIKYAEDKTLYDVLSRSGEQQKNTEDLRSRGFFDEVSKGLKNGQGISSSSQYAGIGLKDAMSGMGLNDEYAALSSTTDLEKQAEIWDRICDSIDKASGSMDGYAGELLKSMSATESMNMQMAALGKNLKTLLESSFGSAITSSMQVLGETLVSSADASEELHDNFQKIGQSLFSQMGQMLVSAGLQMIIANPSNWAMGLTLMAAGGLGSFLSGMMTDTSTDETSKLKQIKEDLADLLKQARDDSVYYENTLRHQTAISTNESVSTRTTSVNDAIIKPNGTIYTNPDDYLYASTDPKNFVGGGSTPNVNFSIVNNGQPVQVESRSQKQTDDGIDIAVVIKSVVSEGLARGEFNDALAVNSSNTQGWSSAR